eukprot:TRINITY_DN319_c0_g1_i1.p1 TRINITY_DN319_c0_g1~~TRINITY_DN319_c0_g1_i1.p1  ORF type:complete len:156 (+),score=41.44 TRINITY_DN319_c0_g1_i1:61-528(+)
MDNGVDDTNVCPSTMRPREEITSLEEERLLRHMTRGKQGHDKAILSKQLKGEAAFAGPEKQFHIYLEGLPAEPGKPLIVVFAGKQVYHSGNANGPITADFKTNIPEGKGSLVEVELKIGTLNFNNQMELDLAGGCNLKLTRTASGLEKKQQVQPF